MKSRWMTLLILLFFGSAAHAQKPIDIVFDIDWAVFYSLKETDTDLKKSQPLFVEGKYYRATDHIAEVVDYLLRTHPEIRISFFSGGERSRNEILLNQVRLPDGKSLKDIAYKILSKEHLTTVSDQNTLPFPERFKKDILKHIPDAQAERAILIDDQVKFAISPMKAVPSGGLFNFNLAYDIQARAEQYQPSDYSQWSLERKKALLWLAYLDGAIRAARQGAAFSTAVSHNWNNFSGIALNRAEHLLQKKLTPLCGRLFY